MSGRSPNSKVSQDVIDNRQQHVASLRVRYKMTLHQIMAALPELDCINPESKRPWSYGIIQKDITDITERWRKSAMIDMQSMRVNLNAEVEEIKTMALTHMDLASALTAIKHQREMFGLDEPKKTQLGGIPGGESIGIQNISIVEGINIANLTPKQLDELEQAIKVLDCLRKGSG